MRSRGDGRSCAEDAALRLVLDHAAELLRFARRFSYCADDANDAYQRAVEILVRRMRTDPPADPLPWVRTVLRREAWAVRVERERVLGCAELDLDRHEDRGVGDLAERVVGQERLQHTAEALGRLKPQEATALVLRAEGLSYAEICRRTGWTYTRTNRAITEGRRALLERLGAIESGAECERWLPLLSALADGEATARELAELRPHLRACPACRATLRDCHGAPAQVALLVPPAVVAAAPHTSLLEQAHVALHAVAERATLLAGRVQGALETLPATKVAAVAASTAALAGSGMALDHATHRRPAAVAEAAAAPTPAAALAPSPLVPARPRADRNPTADAHEFPREPAKPPEFGGQSTPPPEFASSSPSSATDAAAASAPSAPPDAASLPRSDQSEFAGP